MVVAGGRCTMREQPEAVAASTIERLTRDGPRVARRSAQSAKGQLTAAVGGVTVELARLAFTPERDSRGGTRTLDLTIMSRALLPAELPCPELSQAHNLNDRPTHRAPPAPLVPGGSAVTSVPVTRRLRGTPCKTFSDTSGKMTTMSSGKRPPSGSSASIRTPTPSPRSRAEVGALVSQAMDEIRANAATTGRKPGRRAPWYVAAIILSGLALWLWVAKPAFLQPAPATGPSVERQRDALIVLMDATAGRIEAFRLRTQRLPATASEVGLKLPDLQYRRLSDEVFELTGTIAGTPITYHSTMDRTSFAAAARQNLGVSR
jgi:hypothetical protein